MRRPMNAKYVDTQKMRIGLKVSGSNVTNNPLGNVYCDPSQNEYVLGFGKGVDVIISQSNKSNRHSNTAHDQSAIHEGKVFLVTIFLYENLKRKTPQINRTAHN